MARGLNFGALAAAMRGGFRAFKSGEKGGKTESELKFEIFLDDTAVKAAIADMEAELGRFSDKTLRAFMGVRNKMDVVRILQRHDLNRNAPDPATPQRSSQPRVPISADAQARMAKAKQPASLWGYVKTNRQNLFRLAQRGPSQLVSSLFGANQALGFGGATLAAVAAVKAITTVFAAAASYNQFRRQGNSVGEAVKRTALSAVQKVASGILNITGVSAGAGDVAAWWGGVDPETGRRVVREEIERFFETSKERIEREKSETRARVNARSDQLARDHQAYLQLAQSYFDAAPITEYAVVKSIRAGLARFGNERRTAVRDIFNRPVWNVVRRAEIEGAH